MTAKKFLQGIRDGIIEIRVLERSSKRLEASLLPRAIIPKLVTVQESIPEDRIAETLAGIGENRDSAKMIIDRISWQIRLARILIDRIENAGERYILTLYYLTPKEIDDERRDMNSWDDVAALSGFSIQRVFQLHQSGLVSFGEQLDAVKLPEWIKS